MGAAALSKRDLGSRLLGSVSIFRSLSRLDRQQQRAAWLTALHIGNCLIFRLGQRVHLGRTVGTLHLYMLKPQIGQAGHRAALILPPEETATNQRQQQQKADQTQDALRIAHRFLDTAQRMHAAAAGIGAGELIELHRQTVLIHLQQFGVGPDIATGKVGPGSLSKAPASIWARRCGVRLSCVATSAMLSPLISRA